MRNRPSSSRTRPRASGFNSPPALLVTDHVTSHHIGRNTANRSVITEHRLEFDYEFKWDDVIVLDKEPNLGKRDLISEMVIIKRQENSLNLQTDTELLPDIYLTLFEKFPKI